MSFFRGSSQVPSMHLPRIQMMLCGRTAAMAHSCLSTFMMDCSCDHGCQNKLWGVIAFNSISVCAGIRGTVHIGPVLKSLTRNYLCFCCASEASAVCQQIWEVGHIFMCLYLW